MLQALCRRYGIHFSRPGNGICHYVHIERFARPGGILVGADSHTTTSGALGMIAIGAGGLDVAVAMGGHPYEIACPQVVEVRLEGTLARPWVQAKDVILELLRRLTRARRAEQGVRVHGRGHRGPERARARHDRQHDRRARAPPPPCSRRTRTRACGCAARSARTTSPSSPPTPAASTTSAWRSTSTQLGPLVAKPHNPDNVVPVEEVAGTPVEQVCIGSSVNSAYVDLALPAAVLAAEEGRHVHERCTATATPGSRQILVAIAESGVYRQLVEGGVRMLEPVCGPCVGMGQAPPSDANSLRTFNRNFPGRSGTPEDSVYLCSPAVAAVSMLHGEIRDPREYGEPPELLEMPTLKPYVDDVHIFAPAPEEEAEQHRDTARSEHQDAARAHAARGRAERPDRHRPARRHLDRGPRARRRDRHVLPLEHPGDRRVHLPAPRPRVPQADAASGGAASSSAATTTARARRASTRRWRPLQLGVRAVFAKSFARIHRRNLVAQGILALTFVDEDDYELAKVGDTWTLPQREAGARGGGRADHRADRGVRPRARARARPGAQGARDPGERRPAELSEEGGGGCLAPAWIRIWCASASRRWPAAEVFFDGPGGSQTPSEVIDAMVGLPARRRTPTWAAPSAPRPSPTRSSSAPAPRPPTSPAASPRRSPSART